MNHKLHEQIVTAVIITLYFVLKFLANWFMEDDIDDDDDHHS